MLLTLFPAKEARKSPAKLRRKFATNFAENFANFTLEIAGAYLCAFFLPEQLRNTTGFAQKCLFSKAKGQEKRYS